MIKLVLIGLIIFVVLYFLSRILFNTKVEKDGFVNNTSKRRSTMTILLITVVFVAGLIFLLPKLGLTLTGLIQKLFTFLPLIRALIPF